MQAQQAELEKLGNDHELKEDCVKMHASTDTTDGAHHPTNTNCPNKANCPTTVICDHEKQFMQHEDNNEDAHFSAMVPRELFPTDPNDRQLSSQDKTHKPNDASETRENPNRLCHATFGNRVLLCGRSIEAIFAIKTTVFAHCCDAVPKPAEPARNANSHNPTKRGVLPPMITTMMLSKAESAPVRSKLFLSPGFPRQVDHLICHSICHFGDHQSCCSRFPSRESSHNNKKKTKRKQKENKKKRKREKNSTKQKSEKAKKH
jgi:hypothetical protein